MDHGEGAFERGVKCVLGRGLFRGGAVRDQEFGVFNVDVTEVRVPEVIGRRGRGGELPVGESDVDFFSGDG